MFNHEFEKYKQEQQQKMGSQIVQYQEPESRLSMKIKIRHRNLGSGKVAGNFSGETNGYLDSPITKRHLPLIPR